jgi:hypothetical protein
LLDDRKTRIRIRTSYQQIRMWEAQKNIPDPYPQHCYSRKKILN